MHASTCSAAFMIKKSFNLYNATCYIIATLQLLDVATLEQPCFLVVLASYIASCYVGRMRCVWYFEHCG